MNAIKGHTVRVYLQSEPLKKLGEMCEVTGIPQTTLASILLAASIEALQREGGDIRFPLTLSVCSQIAPSRYGRTAVKKPD